MLTKVKTEKIEQQINKVMNASSARGLIISIFDSSNNTLYEKSFGYRDEEKKLPIDSDTLFGLASVSKSFTALSIMKLAEKGLINIYDPVSKYIEGFKSPDENNPVRIIHFLTHSAGYYPQTRITVPEVMKELHIEDSLDNELIYNEEFAAVGLKKVADRLSAQTEFTGKPGDNFSYCNDGFGILSEIIHRVSGLDSFARFIENEIASPLNMTRTNCSFIRSTLDENSSTLYSFENDRWTIDKDFTNDAFVLNGGGALKSTVNDLKKYVSMYMNNGYPLINEQSFNEMIRPRQYVNPSTYYCFGLETYFLGSSRIVEHSGSLPGVSSNIAFSPDSKLGCVILCNTMDVPVSALSRYIYGVLLDTEAIPAPVQGCLSEKIYVNIFGQYHSDEGTDVEITENNGNICFTANGRKKEFIPVFHNGFYTKGQFSDTFGRFIYTRDKDVYAMQYGSRILKKI